MSNHEPTHRARRRPGSRRLRVAVAVLTAGVGLIAPIAVSPALPTVSADDCPDAEVTFARGTDEPPGLGRVGQALVDSLRQQTGMNIGAYGVNYKASLFQLHTDDGSKDAVAHVKSMADKCPSTPQVLGGYSQGASVMDIVAGVSVDGLLRGTTLPANLANNVAAVVTFGNVADRTNKPISAASALLGSKALDLCNPADPICHAGPGNAWSGHTEGYVPVYTNQATKFVMTQLLGSQTPGFSAPSATLAPTYPSPATLAPTYPTPATLAPTYPAPATLAPTYPSPATLAPSTAPESPLTYR